MEFSTGSRARTASAAIDSYVGDYEAAFQPSKRPRRSQNDREFTAIDAAPSSVGACDEPQAASLMERLLTELSSLAAWKLSSERSVVQNEAFLNEQLEHTVLLHGAGEMTAELCRLPCVALVETTGLTPPQQQRIETHVRHAMDIVSWLLVVRQRDMRRQDELLDRVRTLEKENERKDHTIQTLQTDVSLERVDRVVFALEKENERKDHTIQTLQTDVEALKMQLASQENMFHGREQALVTERKTLQQDKKQLEVMCAKLQGQEAAFKTQLRRKDVEYERLKKSLQDAAQRSAKEQRGMSMGKILNGLTERRKMAQRVVQSHETLLSQRLVDNLERKRDELLFENEALAKNFESLQKQVESVSAQYKKAVSLFLAQRGDEFNTDETMELARVPLDDFTPTPLQLGVKSNVPAYIAQTVHKLSDKVRLFERAMQAELDYATSHPSEDLVNRLKEKLAEAQDVITEQDRLIQASLVGPSAALETTSKPGSVSMRGSSFEKENVHINTGKHHLSRFESPKPQRAGRRRPVEHLVLEQWEDSLHTEFQALRRKNQNLTEERKLLQRQGEKLDNDRIAFEMRTFEHFFGGGAMHVDGSDEDIVMEDIDCPTTPRTATYLQSVGIFPSIIE